MKYFVPILMILTGLAGTMHISQVYGQTDSVLDDSNAVNGHLSVPINVAFDSAGDMYVVDSGNNSIKKFGADGNFILKLGSLDKQDGQFECPNDIAVDSDDHIYVTDNCNQRIQIFDTDGKLISKWGKPGSGEGHLLSPTGITLDSDDNVYVVDDSRSSIQKFTNDGKFISIWKTEWDDVCKQPVIFSRDDPCTIGITDITIDAEGNFFIVKRLSHLLEKISSDGTSLAKWKLADNENNKPLYPAGIAIDSAGDLYITSESERPFLYKYSSDGEFITKWLRKDTTYPHYTQGVAIDHLDNVYVSILVGKIGAVEKFTNQGKRIYEIGNLTFYNEDFSIYSPLKQHNMGVSPEYTSCKQDLTLVVNYRYSPSCVKPESMLKLVERGWIVNTSIDGGNPVECYLKPDPGVCGLDITKYYFDWESNSCKSFSWEGCRGTVPLDSLDACMSLCS